MHARKAVWFYCMQPSKESPRDAVTFAHDRSVLWILTNTEQSRCHMKNAGLCASDQGFLEDCHRSMEDALGERGEGGGGVRNGRRGYFELCSAFCSALKCLSHARSTRVTHITRREGLVNVHARSTNLKLSSQNADK